MYPAQLQNLKTDIVSFGVQLSQQGSIFTSQLDANTLVKTTSAHPAGAQAKNSKVEWWPNWIIEIIESPELEKMSKIIQSNCPTVTNISH